MTGLRDVARAKVNLTLRVIGRRADGYHELESVVAFADCADTLSFQPGGDLTLALDGPGAAECGGSDDNLVLKAARLLAQRVPDIRLGAFTLDKRLPVAAGIGGGSADAAAALRLLAQANELAADDAHLFEAAKLAGADVPVCLNSRSCLMMGVGETLAPLRLPALPGVLVNPRVPVATRDVFQALGLKNGELRVGSADILRAPAWPQDDAPVSQWLELIAAGRNDLEAPAVAIAPVIGEVLEMLRAFDGVQLARMSGSGATCFAIFATDADAAHAARALGVAQPAWWVHAGTLG